MQLAIHAPTSIGGAGGPTVSLGLGFLLDTQATIPGVGYFRMLPAEPHVSDKHCGTVPDGIENAAAGSPR